MRLLKNKSVCPPDPLFFSYTHPETGHRSTAIDFYSWIEKCKDHRRANDLPIPSDFEEVAQDQLCSTLDSDWCSYEKEGTWVNMRLALSDIVTVTKALLDSAVGNFVSQEEAERRAKICSMCHFNTNVGGCGVCHQLANLIAPGKTTSQDANLKSCAVCGCQLRAKNWIQLDTLRNNLQSARQDAYPSFCPYKIGGVNYIE